MGENASDFRDTLAELVESTYPEPVDHPSEEQWIAYQKGELPAEEEARLAEHLVRCRDCFDLVQMADALLAPEGEAADGEAGGGTDARALAAVGRLLRPRLAGEDAEESREPVRRAPAGGFHLPYALAASLLIAFLGLGAWNLEQRRAIEAQRAPRPNAPIYDFSPVERLTLTEERTLTAGPWMLVFHPSEELPAYRLTIRDGATGRELSSHPLRPHANLTLTLWIELSPGRYRLELSDGSGAGRVLEQQLVRVVPAGPGG